MRSFKNVIIRSIKRKAFDREYYEEMIASWLLRGWLTEDEATEIFVVLDEYLPSTENTEDNTENVVEE